MIGITINFMFHNFFNSLTRSSYLPGYSYYSYSANCWIVKIHSIDKFFLFLSFQMGLGNLKLPENFVLKLFAQFIVDQLPSPISPAFVFLLCQVCSLCSLLFDLSLFLNILFSCILSIIMIIIIYLKIRQKIAFFSKDTFTYLWKLIANILAGALINPLLKYVQ